MSQSFDINVLREEARSRWLKPSEVYYILKNHERFPITHEAPKKPPSGSLFLYNRRVNRYFRRDGHTWRRKKDGRTVGEAHERLKVGNVDALSCYYAHGEQNPCFQRRCFWMLEPAYEHIVLVQYREVAEGRYYSAQLSNGPPESLSSLGYRSAIYGNQYLSSTSGTSEGSESHQSYSNLSSVTEVSSYSGNKEYNKDGGSLLSIPELGQTCLEQTTEDRADNDNSKHKSGLNVALKKIAEQLSLGDDNDDDYIYSNEAQPLGFATNIEAAGDNQLKQIQPDGTQKGLGRNIAPSWEDVLHSSSGLPTPSIYQSDAQYQQNSEHHPPGSLDSSDLRIHLSAAKRFLLGPEASIDSPASNFMLRSKGNSGHDTLSAHDSRLESSLNPDWRAKAPLTFQSDSQGSEITELLFDHGQFEPYSRADTRLTSGQMKQFNIREISPEWAFSYEITKVIITGEFLCDPSNFCWAVMFGDSEVPVEIVQPGVLRCHTPLHSNGKFRVCITSGNREVCSDFKEFEFRSKHTSSTFSDLAPSSRPLKSSEELLFLAKFSRMLLSENGNSEVPDGDPQSAQFPKLRMNEELWDRLIDELKLGCENPLSTVDQIMEELLKTRLQQWLSVKLKGFNGTASSLSKHEQGIIHLISALGYEWALSSVLSVGVGLNFRDSNGWTALHWAAYFGREKMVAALLAAGASATAVTDPTAQDPVGKTAAFLASERGHTGLAGYLSEVSLTSYLASLTIEESDVSKGSAEVEAERAVESISQRSAQLHGGTEDELSMKDSLAAVRNAAQAAARIQNAFRAFSFRKRQEKTARLKDEYGMTQEDIDELAAASRLLHQSHPSSGQFYDKAAVSIQKKYKGWKGRKHFLNMRRNAVKIQAHVRGHQVRKKYRTIVSTVSVLEKVILRWRRKGHGLRGFRAEQQPMVGAVEDDEEEDDFYDDEAVKVFCRQKVDQAVKESVSRVLSMVNEPYCTPYKDVMPWFAILRRYRGPNHRCMQQAGHKILGRDDIRQKIMQNLLLDKNDGNNCNVICINGQSGLGKTSMLRILYNDQELMGAFDKRIWIQISNKFDVLMLFRKIAEYSMNGHCSITNINLLQELVMEEITNMKFLLFLDDADIEDQQFWTSVLEVLNAGIKGSAVVMATRRSTGAALRDVATHSYFLNPLCEEDNLMLVLQQYAVTGTDIKKSPDLLMIAKRFISMFGTNPLNLKAIGGLLFHAHNISLEMDKSEGIFMPLKLCHDVLPIHLKKCLAFCSLFPKGYIFDKHHMVLQWISHGCVRPAGRGELEDVGVECFNELLCRFFFQYSPVHNDKDDKFVVHELVYKVLESLSRDRYFKSEDLLSSIPENILHLSLVSSRFQTIELMSKTEELTDLQTFMVVQPEWKPYKIPLPTLNLVGLDEFFLKFTSLEILDLSHTDTEELPESIGGLRNLQYLSVNNTSIRTLPSELCSLTNLQTLEAKDCRFLTELPGETKNLLKLRHLDVTKELGYVHLPHGIGHLTELRTLPVFHASSDSSHCSISELGNLHNLRGCLWLSGLESVKTGSMAQDANMKYKHHLKDLTLQWQDDGINIDDEDEDTETVAEQVLERLQPHTNLQELAIRGYEGGSFPAWMQSCSSLPNLVSLTLDGCCNCTQFPAITHLSSLKFLGIRKMYDVKQLSNTSHGETKFPSLELLNIWEMYGLEELFEASEGDCPRLCKVCVSRCPDLKRLPCVHSLTELVLHCGGRQLPDIPELASLVSLKIGGFHGVTSFGLPALPALKKLEIRSCKELSSVEGLSALTTVQRLMVAGCPKLVLPRTESLMT